MLLERRTLGPSMEVVFMPWVTVINQRTMPTVGSFRETDCWTWKGRVCARRQIWTSTLIQYGPTVFEPVARHQLPPLYVQDCDHVRLFCFLFPASPAYVFRFSDITLDYFVFCLVVFPVYVTPCYVLLFLVSFFCYALFQFSCQFLVRSKTTVNLFGNGTVRNSLSVITPAVL